LVKHKAGLATLIPNSIIFHNAIYALKTVEDIQNQQHISLILYQLNHPEFDTSTFKIRIQQLQNVAATTQSILQYYNYIIAQPEHLSPSAQIIK
ncbi:12790_t:CDS:1, partial [Racocetra persica]